MIKSVSAILLGLSLGQVWACSSLLQKYPFECALQDKYQSVKDSLKNDFGVEAEYTVAYRTLRLVEQDEYDRRKDEVNYMPWKIYDPAPVTWQMWEQGAAMVDSMVDDTSMSGLTLEEIEKLNQVLITKQMMTFLSRLKGNTPGRIRTGKVIAPPGMEFKCNENSMSDNDYRMLQNYDIKDYENEPLMRLKYFKQCKQGGYGGQIWYLAGNKVPKEMDRWIAHFNSYFQKFMNGDQTDMSPIEFITFSQRWFIAIHPFGDGNGRTSRFIQDMFMKKLGLPFIPTGRISMLSTRSEYLRHTKKEVGRSVEYLEGCLTGYQKHQSNPRIKVIGHCLPMYQDIDTGESGRLKSERVQFANDLQSTLNVSVK